MAQVPAGIGRQQYCLIGQPNTAKLIAVWIDRRDEMWISLALPWQIGAPERLMSLIGSTIPFSATEGQRAAKGDPGRSIAVRYPGKAAYLDEVSHAAQCLINASYLLSEDFERILAQSARRWDLLASAPESAAAQ